MAHLKTDGRAQGTLLTKGPFIDIIRGRQAKDPRGLSKAYMKIKNNKIPPSARAASKKFAEGCRCSEAILVEYGSRVGLAPDLAMKIGCAFGGGLGSTGDVCGALTASIMILGLKHGRTDKGDAARRIATDSRVKEFLEKFKQKYKHLRCNDLLGFDRSTPEGHDRAAAAGVFKKLCPRYVEHAATILEELLGK